MFVPPKLRGRFTRPRGFTFATGQFSASFLRPFSLSFWLPWLPILPSIIHGSRNGRLLRLSECIESIKCEVKKKMMHELDRRGVRRSRRSDRDQEILV